MKIGTVYQPIVCVARDCSILTQYIEDWWHGTILSLNPEGSFGHRSSKSCIDTLKTKGALPLQWSSQESGVAGPGCEHIGCADARLWCAGQKFEPPAACRDLVSHVAGVFSESQPSVMGAGLAVSILSIYTSKVSWGWKIEKKIACYYLVFLFCFVRKTLFYVHECLPDWLHHVHVWCPRKPEEGIEPLEQWFATPWGRTTFI